MIESAIGTPLPANPIFFEGLGIDGDDCVELMKSLAIKYEIDMTDYQPLDYQATEYEIGTSWFGEVKLDHQLKTFDFEHLVSVIDQKKWYNPR
ncbi:hypothetical protein BWI96_11850 [Siphonobacter sp. SORGH_AS_0500]|uniref:hypothetical protein n=1 Tax=Siphonobacter sp. SORGH_AS_0500 TaxID=1864824 RepID=UPI000CBC6A2B|nr:hypothetical protein [Siphonobacter sp. SORGH_AS_0500]PKK36541.1 hypothetical protein BWI96_11850 [Siphonobacter sp. SORGH_AS_0500]